MFRAFHLCVLGRADEAAELLDAVVAVEPYSLIVQTTLAIVSIFRRSYADAIAHLEIVSGPMPDGYEQQMLALRGAASARLGRRDDALEALAEIRALGMRGRYVSSYNLACVLLALGKTNDAILTMEHGLEGRDPWLIFVPVHPEFDGVRDEPRFRGLVERIRTPQP